MGVPGWVPVDIFSSDNEMRKDRASRIRTVPFGFFGKEFDESCLREVVPSSMQCNLGLVVGCGYVPIDRIDPCPKFAL